MKILITSGGTRIPLDEVRHIGNMSSGKFGCELAKEALLAGHEVTFLCAKGSHRPDDVTLDLTSPNLMENVGKLLADQKYLSLVKSSQLCVRQYSNFVHYAGMLEALVTGQKYDVIMLCAAVSDYGTQADLDHFNPYRASDEQPKVGKISSDKESVTFTLYRLPKLITKIKEWCPTSLLVGFKLLVGTTPELMYEAASKQIASAGSDLVVVNDLHMMKRGDHKLFIYEKQALTDNPIVLSHASSLIQLVAQVVKHGEHSIHPLNRLLHSDLEFPKLRF